MVSHFFPLLSILARFHTMSIPQHTRSFTGSHQTHMLVICHSDPARERGKNLATHPRRGSPLAACWRLACIRRRSVRFAQDDGSVVWRIRQKEATTGLVAQEQRGLRLRPSLYPKKFHSRHKDRLSQRF